MRSRSSNGSRRSQEPRQDQNDIHNISTVFAGDIIQNALNILNQTEQPQQQESAPETNPFSHQTSQPPELQSKDNSFASEEIELKDLSESQNNQPAIINVPEPEIITPRWTSANSFTSTLDESTRL